MMIKHIPHIILIIFMLAASCTIGPEYEKPKAPEKEEWTQKTTGADPDKLIQIDWWRSFQDPVLDELVQEAITDSYDLNILFGRIRAAGALTKKTQADLLPRLDLTTQAEFARTETTGSSQNIDIRAGVSWELDIWGKKKQEVEARQAEYKALEADYRAGFLKLVAETGNSYFQVRQFDQQNAYAQQAYTDHKTFLSIYTRQYQQGLVAESKMRRQRAQVSETKQKILEIQRQRTLQQNRLATLLGKAAGDFTLPAAGENPVVRPVDIPMGLPSDLLLRRPDIQAAEYRLEKAIKLIGAARADRFPSISLTARGGFASAALGSLLSGGFLGIVPQITLPIFDGGSRKQEVEIKKAEADIAANEYAKSVLLAFEEVEAALTNIASRKSQVEVLKRRIEDLDIIKQQIQQKLELGLISQLELLDIEVNLYEAREALPQLERYLLDDTITLYKALGGGWPTEIIK